jgi:hypothetical protein
VYRNLVRLYPKAFRREFTDDLVQNFNDLLASRGALGAWQRAAVDLAVTLPRYRLEHLMSPRRADTTLYVTTGVVAGLAVLGITTGFFGAGATLAIAAIVLIITSWSRLARSTRPPDRRRRRRLLVASGALAALCVTTTTAFWIELSGDASWHGGKLVLYNAVFFATAISALVCLIVGVRTPRTPTQPTTANPL